MHKPNRNKFRITRFIILKASRFVKFVSKFRTSEKRILVIKIDAIGDYILFRNYLEVLKESEKYKGYEIDLIGNIHWKDLALTYDSGFLAKTWFIDEEPLYYQPTNLIKLASSLFKRKYKIVIQSTYSRTLMGNGLSILASGKETIAYSSSHEHHPKYKNKTDKFYSTLIERPSHVNHEMDRNHFFFEKILERKLPVLTPHIPVRQKERNKIIIFAGSNDIRRNWEKEKFLEIIQRILLQTNEHIQLAGGPNDIQTANFIQKKIPATGRVINLTGKTSLPELTELIASAKLVISNDTSAVHIASATQTPVICIQGGGHFNRFTPYPSYHNFKPICVYKELPCYHCNWKCSFIKSDTETFPCIQQVSVDRVWAEIVKQIQS
ncbi:glycosyltransferase family 9 protein [Desertivirga xinjiangensis]|uniref:glycosyltransferase family 9 protein n=1 Tax=Desertivirga xinjiangensis TaxID=539206 RepID=UPI00210A9C76|nr:glycosyltransferase family 9 protein [Pedobacter xinjiangensis]